MARKLYKTLVGTHKKAADGIYKLRDLVLTGTMIAVDPGSNSLGFAFYKQGVLVKSGNLKAKGAIGKRLAAMVKELRAEAEGLDMYPPDIAVTEFVRTSTGHHYLTWSSGAAVGALGSEHTIEVHTASWKKLVTKSYIKNDENDAIAIGNYVVELCKEVE